MKILTEGEIMTTNEDIHVITGFLTWFEKDYEQMKIFLRARVCIHPLAGYHNIFLVRKFSRKESMTEFNSDDFRIPKIFGKDECIEGMPAIYIPHAHFWVEQIPIKIIEIEEGDGFHSEIDNGPSGAIFLDGNYFITSGKYCSGVQDWRRGIC